MHLDTSTFRSFTPNHDSCVVDRWGGGMVPIDSWSVTRNSSFPSFVPFPPPLRSLPSSLPFYFPLFLPTVVQGGDLVFARLVRQLSRETDSVALVPSSSPNVPEVGNSV